MGERYLYRPSHPLADEFGCVPAYYAGAIEPPSHGIQLIKDVEPFLSPIDQTVIGSRSEIREHEKRHGVRQIGNDWSGRERPQWWDRRKEIARTGKVPE